MSIISPQYISVTQPIGTFYITAMKAGLLLNVVDILRRDFSPEGRERVQREYSDEQGEKIGRYSIGDDATFPTSIILSSYKDCVRVNDPKKVLELGRLMPIKNNDNSDVEYEWQPLSEQNPFKIGEIVDGQHRLLGIKYAIEKLGATHLMDFELPVVFMLDLNPSDKAYVFSIINGTQRRVSSSLIVDLFGLREGRSPRKTCHELAEIFYKWPGGPFEKGLKMLGKKTQDGEMLSQGSFSKYILRLISRRQDQDDYRLSLGEPLLPDEKCPLREFYNAEKDAAIARILHEYFSAIKDKFKEEWTYNPEDYLLRKTVGFAALTKAFIYTWDKQKVSDPETAKIFFSELADNFKNNLGERKLTSAFFASSEKGAQDLADALTGKDQYINKP